jgi:hypothetical protein
MVLQCQVRGLPPFRAAKQLALPAWEEQVAQTLIDLALLGSCLVVPKAELVFVLGFVMELAVLSLLARAGVVLCLGRDLTGLWASSPLMSAWVVVASFRLVGRTV